MISKEHVTKLSHFMLTFFLEIPKGQGYSSRSSFCAKSLPMRFGNQLCFRGFAIFTKMSQIKQGLVPTYGRRKSLKPLIFDSKGQYIFKPSPLLKNFGLLHDLNVKEDCKINYILRYCIKPDLEKNYVLNNCIKND